MEDNRTLMVEEGKLEQPAPVIELLPSALDTESLISDDCSEDSSKPQPLFLGGPKYLRPEKFPKTARLQFDSTPLIGLIHALAVELTCKRRHTRQGMTAILALMRDLDLGEALLRDEVRDWFPHSAQDILRYIESKIQRSATRE